MTVCSNCGMQNLTWSENLRKNSKGEMRHWLIEQSGRDHKCMGWAQQGYRDAKIKDTTYTERERLYFKLVCGPNGSKGKREMAKIEADSSPSQVMIDAYRAEMAAKGIDIDAPPKEKPKNKQKRLR